MLYPLYEFQARENLTKSIIIDITEKARVGIYDLNKVIYQLYSNYKEIFNNQDILDSLKKLAILHKEADIYLLNPDYSISVIGTTSSGKSTFINSLLGIRLSPMNSDELSIGSLTFSYSKDVNNLAKVDIKTEIANNLWDNGTFEEDYNKAYNRIKSVMEIYRKNLENKDLSPPHITVYCKNFLGNNPNFIGIDNNVNIKIMELPWSIIASESFDFVVNDIKSSLTIFVIDYTVLFHKETKEIDTLLKKILDTKKGTGSDKSLIFLLNKIDLRNQDDEDVEISIEKSKKEIMKRLGQDEKIDICTINSLLNYYMQLIFTAYENYDLKSYEPNIEITEDKKLFIEFIHRTLKNCFVDQAKAITELEENNNLYEIIQNIKKILRENKIPSFEDFKKLWVASLKHSGMINLFTLLKNKSLEHLNSIILYKGLNNLLLETNSLINLLNDSISICKKNDEEFINQEDKYIKDNFELIKNTIYDIKNKLESSVKNSLEALRVFNENQKEAIKNLDIGDIDQIPILVRKNVEKNSILAFERGIIDEMRADKFSSLLETFYSWNSKFSNEIIDDFDFLRTKLYSERKFIDEGRKFEIKENDVYEQQKLDEIKIKFENICKILSNVMNEKYKILFQENIDEISIRINSWLSKRIKELEESVNELLKNLRNQYELNKHKPEIINTFNHNYDFLEHLKIEPKHTRNKEEIIIDERPVKKSWYQFWINEDKVEVIKEEKKFEFYDSIRNQVTNWTMSLSNIEYIIWIKLCDVLKTFFEIALNYYDNILNKILNDVVEIINKEFSNLEVTKYNIDKKWKDVYTLYDKLKDINISLHHLSEIPLN
ncbi:MAG: hypothetical protein KatS3mg068_1876 [Candidatus Sericytochromatia bacterium]|nr:MAG: hypothetical protein KatS3mg068_1876 [Candidatus Sericytochromatia bacterium]